VHNDGGGQDNVGAVWYELEFADAVRTAHFFQPLDQFLEFIDSDDFITRAFEEFLAQFPHPFHIATRANIQVNRFFADLPFDPPSGGFGIFLDEQAEVRVRSAGGNVETSIDFEFIKQMYRPHVETFSRNDIRSVGDRAFYTTTADVYQNSPFLAQVDYIGNRKRYQARFFIPIYDLELDATAVYSAIDQDSPLAVSSIALLAMART
jgi:hypothetical protein